MSDNEQNTEAMIRAFVALVNERDSIEKQLASSVESDEKIRLSAHRDEIVNKLKEIAPKVWELSSSVNPSVIAAAMEDVDPRYKVAAEIAIFDEVPIEKGPRPLRIWWHSILRKFGKHTCYAVFLLLPSDKEMISYLSEFGKELDLLAGKECLIIAFGKSELKGPKFDNSAWASVVDEHVSEGISITLAKIFNVEFTQFPCLIVFNDIRSPEHVVITFRDCTSEYIAKNMRQVFSAINKAVSKEQDPVHALSLLRKAENFQKTGLSIVSGIQSFAGKTLDTAMEAFIKASIK